MPLIDRDQPQDVFRLLVESAPDAVVVVESGGRISLVNRRAEELFGYSRDEIVGQSVDVLVPAEMRAAHAGHRARYEAAPRVRPMGGGLVLHGLRKDGSEFPAEIQLAPAETESGFFVICSVRDVSERMAMVGALRESEERLQLALGAGHLLVWEHDLTTDEVVWLAGGGGGRERRACASLRARPSRHRQAGRRGASPGRLRPTP